MAKDSSGVDVGLHVLVTPEGEVRGAVGEIIGGSDEERRAAGDFLEYVMGCEPDAEIASDRRSGGIAVSWNPRRSGAARWQPSGSAWKRNGNRHTDD